jgi:hypothetical protein
VPRNMTSIMILKYSRILGKGQEEFDSIIAIHPFLLDNFG